jgi:hypothetical protein
MHDGHDAMITKVCFHWSFVGGDVGRRLDPEQNTRKRPIETPKETALAALSSRPSESTIVFFSLFVTNQAATAMWFLKSLMST